MAVTGTNITLTTRTAKGSALTHAELDENQTGLKDAVEGHSHDEFATEPGADGVGVSAVAINGSGNLIITLSTGSTIDAGALPSGGGTGDMLKSTYDSDGDGHISYNDLEDKPTLGTAAAADIAAFEPAGAASIAVAAILDTAPTTLDTLNELAAALGDDPNFATTITTALAGKQATLVSGTNIKTINGASVLGSGDIVVSGGGASVQQSAVTLAQDASTNITGTTVIGVYELVSGISLVPTMTSNTTPSGTVTADGYSNATYLPYNAFDGNATYPDMWQVNTAFPHYLGYEFPSLVTLGSYSLQVPSTFGPKTWTFEGWNGSSWDVLDTRTNITNWAVGNDAPQHFVLSANTSIYSKFRWNISASTDAGSVGIIEAKLYSAAIPFILTPNIDFSITKAMLAGSGTITIKRLKAGTASMTIDYI